jgi:hypothetical protein
LVAAVEREQIPEAWFNLGLARLRLADRSGAELAFRRYLALAPEGRRREEVERFLAQEPPR